MFNEREHLTAIKDAIRDWRAARGVGDNQREADCQDALHKACAACALAGRADAVDPADTTTRLLRQAASELGLDGTQWHWYFDNGHGRLVSEWLP
jgi:hypothetical protein